MSNNTIFFLFRQELFHIHIILLLPKLICRRIVHDVATQRLFLLAHSLIAHRRAPARLSLWRRTLLPVSNLRLLLNNQRAVLSDGSLVIGRGRRIRTLDTRFWRPMLYQLSYTPISIINAAFTLIHNSA